MIKIGTGMGIPVLLLGLAGCATGPSGQKQNTPEQDVKAKCNQFYADSRIDPVRGRIQVPLTFGAPQDIDKLANRTRASDADRPAIKALWEAQEACRRYGEEKLGSMPSYRAISDDEMSDALADLYDGTITYGQFARRTLYIGDRDRAARERVDEEIRQREKWRQVHDYDN
jgi:hypothetical protein